MCGLFGLLDYQRQLSTDERQNMLNALAIESEIRGKDATGIAYYNKNRLCVQKAPFPAHLMQFPFPHKASFIIGHTRAATHGLAKDNSNNHPFVGHANGSFALAHTGVMVQILKECKNQRSNSERLVCQQDGTPYHPDSFTQKFQRFLVRNDLPHIRLHDLRHASATLMIEHGVDIKTVQARLGHSDISTTLNIYSHSTEKMNRTAADKLDAVLL